MSLASRAKTLRDVYIKSWAGYVFITALLIVIVLPSESGLSATVVKVGWAGSMSAMLAMLPRLSADIEIGNEYIIPVTVYVSFLTTYFVSDIASFEQFAFYQFPILIFPAVVYSAIYTMYKADESDLKHA